MLSAVWIWNSGRRLRQAKYFGRVDGHAAAEPDDGFHRRQRRELFLEDLLVDGFDEIAVIDRALQRLLELRPHIFHGHEQEGPVHEVLQLADEIAAEDGLEIMGELHGGGNPLRAGTGQGAR